MHFDFDFDFYKNRAFTMRFDFDFDFDFYKNYYQNRIFYFPIENSKS